MPPEPSPGCCPAATRRVRDLGNVRVVGPRIVAVYEGAPHGVTVTDRERFNADLVAFARS